MLTPRSRNLVARLFAAAILAGTAIAEEPHATGTPSGFRQHETRRPKPLAVEPPPISQAGRAPADAVILFDGSGLDAWRSKQGGPASWRVADGAFEVAPGAGAILTKREFGDVQLHVEWAAPKPPVGVSQDRGNSGVFLMGLFEVQVLDSHKADTYADGQAGAIYGQFPPIFNASRPPGEWQTYDIAFRRPRFGSGGKLSEPARLTVIHNGILIQNNEELLGETSWLRSPPFDPTVDRGPIELQDHGHPVRFRNMWLREIPERPAPRAEDLKRPAVQALSSEALDRFVGSYSTRSRGDASVWKISRGEGFLIVQLPFQKQPINIHSTSESVFAILHTDARFSFKKDSAGRVTGATFYVADGERELIKNP